MKITVKEAFETKKKCKSDNFEVSLIEFQEELYGVRYYKVYFGYGYYMTLHDIAELELAE